MNNPFTSTIPESYTKGTVNHKDEYRELESRLSKFYRKNCYWMCHKFPIQKVKQAFHKKEKEGDTNLNHLIQEIKTI